MSCYKPLKAFPIGYTKNNKIDYKITSYSINHLEKINNQWYPVDNTKISAYAEKTVSNFIEVPCGQCIGCRIDHSKEWADRCMLEMASTSDKTYFVTLTYDEAHLPSEIVEKDTGELLNLHSLQKRDFQLFMKRLRKAYDQKFSGKKLRYFACGEYGSLTFRPHYHAIIFGLVLDDLVLWKPSGLGYSYYNSDWLSNIWQKGFVVVAEANYETCAYVARYITKKWKGSQSKEVYHDFTLEPEFSLMSRKPGIGSEYVDSYGLENWFALEKHYCGSASGSHQIKTNNRYFQKKLEKIDPELLLNLKVVNQESALAVQAAKLNQTSNSYLKMLAVEEAAFDNKIKKLVRKEV